VLIDALEEAGFTVKTLANGEEAIELFKSEAAAEYVALITDINLAQRLTGWDLAQKAREINAALPVVYMTGAAADEWPSRGVPNSILSRNLSRPLRSSPRSRSC
jgi:DNA-binding response OmpR family regulator